MKVKYKINKCNIKIEKIIYKYNIQKFINGYYCGEGRFCKNYFDVIKYIIKGA